MSVYTVKRPEELMVLCDMCKDAKGERELRRMAEVWQARRDGGITCMFDSGSITVELMGSFKRGRVMRSNPFGEAYRCADIHYYKAYRWCSTHLKKKR